MAVLKHIAIKNMDYRAAYDYLTTQHDEFTGKPVLDDLGRHIMRDEFIMDGINCDPASFKEECDAVNARYGKNRTRSEIKSHHYIISFDPRDRDENNLTPETAQKLGMEFAHKYFPGHQIIVCTHPDGHNSAGNIHVHIVLNSVRAMDVEREDFMERPGDALAGHKHHVTRNFLEFLKQQTMDMCQQHSLNQVDLLHPAKVRITEREYWAQRRGQKNLDAQFPAIDTKKHESPRFETRKMQLRTIITTTMQDSISYEEFLRKLFETYGISVHENRGRISYCLPDRTQAIRGRSLGTDYEMGNILAYFTAKSEHKNISFNSSTSRHSASPNTDKRIGYITDISTIEKARKNIYYAAAIHADNAQKMVDTAAFIARHGLHADELPSLLASVSSDFETKKTALKATENELHKLSPIIQATRQYYKTREVHTEYLKSKNKKSFRENHAADLAVYDAAVHDLRAHYGDQKFLPLNKLLTTERELRRKKNEQYEKYCFSRARYRELQTVAANAKTILGGRQSLEEKQTR